MSPILIAVIVAAGIFELVNGFHDTANAIATTVYTKALPPRVAIVASALMNFLGALMNEGVAMTIATGLIAITPELYVILAALLGAVVWDLLTWWFGIPSSSSHALIGALVGATIVFTGSTDAVIWEGLVGRVVIPLFTSPAMGFCLGYFVMKAVFWLFANWTPARANSLFHKAQICSSMFMAYSHGSNDAQKTMGIITMALVSAGVISADVGIPTYVKIGCAITMAAGTMLGGQKIMKTVGDGVTKLEPVMGFVSELSSAVAIETMTALGAPVSTTQVVTTAVMGAGSSRRVSSVRWGMAGNIVKAWFITLPITMLLGGGMAWLIGLFL